jgi:predicted dehydrogenase
MARLAARLPARALIALLNGAERVMQATTKGKADVGQLRELRDLLRDDPKGREAVRRIILEARGPQFRAVLQGVLRHHVEAPAPAAPTFAAVAAFPGRQAAAPARIAFAGEHWEFPFLRDAYAARPDCRIVPAGEPADGVEIALDRPEAADLARQTMAAGAAVSLHAGPAADAATVAALFADAQSRGVPVRLFYSYLYFAPAVRLRELLAAGEIGELTTVRVRAVLGGKGAALSLAPPFGDWPLRHPAFDHFPLLTFLGGPAARLAAYVGPMDGAGGQALIGVRFAAAGRVGALECAYAPDMHVRSAFYPHDLQVEVAGTDGVIWLRRGMAETTQEPPLAVRAGRSAYTIGIESGMTGDWAEVYRAAAAEFVGAVGGRLVRRLGVAETISAFRLRDKVYDAATTPGVVELPAAGE